MPWKPSQPAMKSQTSSSSLYVIRALLQRGDLVLDDLLLAIDRDLAAGQAEHVDVERAVVEAQEDARVVEPLAVEPVGDADLMQDVDGVLLEQPGAHSLLDVRAVADLEHDAVDARLVQQQREREAGRPGADDPDLGIHPAGDPT